MLIPTIDAEKKLDFKLEIEVNSDKNNTFTLILNADNHSYLNIKAIQKMIYLINHFQINLVQIK